MRNERGVKRGLLSILLVHSRETGKSGLTWDPSLKQQTRRLTGEIPSFWLCIYSPLTIHSFSGLVPFPPFFLHIKHRTLRDCPPSLCIASLFLSHSFRFRLSFQFKPLVQVFSFETFWIACWLCRVVFSTTPRRQHYFDFAFLASRSSNVLLRDLLSSAASLSISLGVPISCPSHDSFELCEFSRLFPVLCSLAGIPNPSSLLCIAVELLASLLEPFLPKESLLTIFWQLCESHELIQIGVGVKWVSERGECEIETAN